MGDIFRDFELLQKAFREEEHKRDSRGRFTKMGDVGGKKEVDVTTIESTAAANKDSEGNYTPERKALHKKILSDLLKSAGETNKNGKPVVVILGGGTASGKSSIRGAISSDVFKRDGQDMGFATVDSDDIKREFPETQKMIDAGLTDWAARTHDESSDITLAGIEMLTKAQKNFVYDGTMKNADKYANIIDKFRKAGYDVHIYVADAPIDVAVDRAEKRGHGKEKRFVDIDVILDSHTNIPNSFERLKDKADSYFLYDTNSGDTPKMVASKGYLDQEMYGRFLMKADINAAEYKAKYTTLYPNRK